MELLAEIHEKDLGIKEEKKVKYLPRKAARAVLYNDKKQIAFLYVSKHHYHKLPGGGIEEDESIETALAREVLEEFGCTIKVNSELGLIIEYRNQFEQIQLSYCYLAKVKENHGRQQYTEKELSQGFQLQWVNLNEAIKLLEQDQPTTYEGKFIVNRDLTFLKKAKKLV